MIYQIYQIQFNGRMIKRINNQEPLATRIYHRYLKTISFPDPEAIVYAFPLYRHVANITADGLNEVFHIGNMGPENKIERLRSMHSVSVGDVIIGLNDKLEPTAWYVDSFGFKEVPDFYELLMIDLT
jgi:hypothetical protein